MPPIEFYLHSEQDCMQLAQFWENYTLEKEVVCPEEKPPSLTPKEQRVCRYCGVKGGKHWKGEAHLFPHFLGNNTLFADDECGTCNHKFGKWETDLAAFLGVARTINQVKGKRGVPKAKSDDKKVVVTGNEIWYNAKNVRIDNSEGSTDNFNIDHKKGICEIIVTKESYTPFYVYKALIKIAYSILPAEVLPMYSSTRDFITGNQLDQVFSKACIINKVTYSFGHGTKSPFLLLCKKKDPMKNVPTHCVLFFWENHFYQFSVPYHEEDIANFAGKPLLNIAVPPFSFYKNQKLKSTQESVDLQSQELLKKEKEVLRIEYDNSIPIVGYDPETQQLIEKPFDEWNVKGIRIVSNGVHFTLPIKKSDSSTQQ